MRPVPRTLTYYDFNELAAYVREANFKAIWIVNRINWIDAGESSIDAADKARDIAEYPTAYHEGAAEQVAWFRAEFGDRIVVRR